MPEGADRFRGIHDPDMVRRGLTISTGSTGATAHLEIRSTRVGHRLPTYIMPWVAMSGSLLDQDGHPIRGGDYEKALQPWVSMENGRWTEHSDTSLKLSTAETIRVSWQAGGLCASAARFRIMVDPGWYYYKGAYPVVLEELEEGAARGLVKQAKSMSESNRYVLFETTLDRDCANGKRKP